MFCCVLVIVLGLAVSPSRAAPVAPGQTVDISDAAFTPPSGQVVAEDIRPVTFLYSNSNPNLEFAPGADQVTVTFTSRVYRDAGSGNLTFSYDLSRPNTGQNFGGEGAAAAIAAFTGFSTDVTGTNDGPLIITRPADGASLLINGGTQGDAGVPTLAVATDATNFDRSGSVIFSLSDEFNFIDTRDPESGTTLDGAAAQLTIPDTFQPAAGGPTSIPLPSGARAGIGMLGAIVAASMIRRARFSM
jgi:hypothetical protein